MDVEIIVIENLFPEIAGRIESGMPGALDTLGQTAKAAADAVTRVRTGALVGNQTVTNDGQTWTNTWEMSYAIYQAEGTYKMSGTHFPEVGIDAAAGQAGAIVSAALGF